MELTMWLSIGLIAALLIGCTPLLPIVVVAMVIVVLVTIVRHNRERRHYRLGIEQALRTVGHSTMVECRAHACSCGRRIRTLRYKINKINNRIDYLTQLGIVDSALPYAGTNYDSTINTLKGMRIRAIEQLRVITRKRIELDNILAMQEQSGIEQPVSDSDEIVPLSEKYLW
jgi:hypothetical protein